MADFDLKTFFLSWRMYLLAVSVAAALLWCVPPWQVEQVRGRFDKPDEYSLANLEDAYRRTLAQILGGLALLYGLYLTHRRIVATEDNVSIAQEGQVTERFTRAIKQLGDEEMAIRLGGIYALERLAKDSGKDHGPIMEVLTAYVREKAPRQKADTPEEPEPPPTDIQAILTVIGRREPPSNKDRLDLTHTQLSGANLNEAKLMRADLSGADLRKADLSGADLSGTLLYNADLSGADLSGAVLYGADLSGADLSEAVLRRANLHMANLREAENLTAEQVQTAENWRDARLPASL